MKYNSLFLFIILGIKIVAAQDYIDLVKINYGTVLNAGFEDSDAQTDITLWDVGVTYPIPINDRTAIITGLDFLQEGLDLFPGSSQTSLRSMVLKAGLSLKHSDRWSGTYLFLPKIASEDLHTDGDHWFFGGLVLFKYQKNSRLQYRFGSYISTEGFGVLMTPILGLYYLSDNADWEATFNLPINADINYRFNPATTVGFGFQAPVRSFRLNREENTTPLYTQSSRIEFGPYVQYGFWNQSILMRLQGGYSSMSYEVFEERDTLPIRLSALEFGDDRNLINPEMKGNLFVRIGATYRFHLDTKKRKKVGVVKNNIK